MNIDPLRERDLPDSERMLSRILDRSADDTVEMGIEHLGEPLRRPRRVLQLVAAAAVVVAIGGLGWSVTQPTSTGAQPGGRPGLQPLLSPTPTPTPEVTTSRESGPTPSRTPQPTPPTTGPTPAVTPQRSVNRTQSTALTPGATATPAPSPTPSPSPSRTPQRPSIAVVNTVRFEVGDVTYLTVNYRVCAGSAPGSLRGPLISGVRPDATNGSAAMASPLADGTVVQAGSCQVFSDTWQTEAQSGRVSVHVTPTGEPESEWADYYAAVFG